MAAEHAAGRSARVDFARARARLDALALGDTLEPSRAREILLARAAQLARPPERLDAGDASLLLQVWLGRQRYALEMQIVVEIRKAERLACLPGAPAHLVGVANLRGSIIPVFDLRRLLGIGSAEAERPDGDAGAREGESAVDPRIVIVGRAEPEFGLAVDAVDEIVVLRQADLHAPSELPPGLVGQHVRGVTHDALVVLDSAWLVDGRELDLSNELEASSTETST